MCASAYLASCSFSSGPENVKTLIEATYTNYNTDDTDYPVLKGFVMHGFMPPPQTTRSSELLTSSIKQKMEDENKPRKHFVMKRFRNVSSSISSRRNLVAT